MFAYAHAAGGDWRACVQACLARLGKPGTGLGFAYFTDALVDDAPKILDALRSASGVEDWIGTVGTGVLATGAEYQDGPALAVMVAEINDYAVFSGRAPLRREAHWAVVHADPGAPDVAGLVADMAAKVSTGYLVGGLSSSRSRTVQLANGVLTGGLSGAAFGASVPVATRLTQGCVPICGRLRVTEAEENIIAALDGRPALEVLEEVVGERRLQILVGLLPAPGSRAGDLRGDYTARNLIGADPKTGVIAICDVVETGSELFFCKRDGDAARQDLLRIATELRASAPGARGALYYSCVARGEHMFGTRGAELQLVQGALGEVPLVGFFCNGEISSDRLYGYTGVLSVFP
jgi:small ligand-binding sensory domain FIST